MADLCLTKMRDLSLRRPEVAEENPEDLEVGDLQESVNLEEARVMYATIAIGRVTMLETARRNLQDQEETEMSPEVPMADASSVMRRVIRKLTVLIEEVKVIEEVVEEGDQAQFLEAPPEKDQDQQDQGQDLVHIEGHIHLRGAHTRDLPLQEVTKNTRVRVVDQDLAQDLQEEKTDQQVVIPIEKVRSPEIMTKMKNLQTMLRLKQLTKINTTLIKVLSNRPKLLQMFQGPHNEEIPKIMDCN
jgi:hypothetical protein